MTSPSKKIYIGITKKTLEQRKQRHTINAKNGSPYLIHKAIRKYKDLLIWEIIDKVSSWKEACELEKQLIIKFNSFAPNGYNCTHGGDGRCAPMPKQVIERIASKKRGKPSWNKGRIDSKEERIKKSIVRGGKPFLVYEVASGKYIGRYINKKLCAEELKISSDGNIHSCLKGIRTKTNGYRFVYEP